MAEQKKVGRHSYWQPWKDRLREVTYGKRNREGHWSCKLCGARSEGIVLPFFESVFLQLPPEGYPVYSENLCGDGLVVPDLL